MLVDKRYATTLLLFSGILFQYVVAVTEKASKLTDDQEKIEAFLKFSKLLESENTASADTDEQESGSTSDDDDDESQLKSSDGSKFHHINATFLLLKEAQQLLNKTAKILPTPSKRRTKNVYEHNIQKTEYSPLVDTDNKATNNPVYATSNYQGLAVPYQNTWSYRPTLQIANITYQGMEQGLTNRNNIKNKHRNKNGRHTGVRTFQNGKQSQIKSSKINNTNYYIKNIAAMLITPKKQLNTQYIEDGKFTAETLPRDFKPMKLNERKQKSKNKTKEVRGPSAIDIVKSENLTDIDSDKNDSLKKEIEEKSASLNVDESEEQKLTKESSQDSQALKVQELLSKLTFNNGVSGKVKAGQEFAYISQCGLYTEPQNVSMVQHAWVTKTYSPYFYLYEKPKKYEKCKPSAWMNGTDIRGSVFLSFEVKSLHGSTMENNAKICEKYCCKEPRCAAWVLRFQSDATSNCPENSYCCWLKTDVPKPEPHDDCVSGIVHRDHYKHPPNGMRSAVPLGGLGTGSFELRADGTFHEWTVENQSPGGSAKLSKTSLEMMMLGVRVKKGTSKPHSAVLRTHAPHGFDSVESIAYSGSHPVSRLKIDFNKQLRKDVELTLYAYSAFHPRSPKSSATPAVIFTLDVKNPSTEDLDVSFMMNLPFGYNDDTIRRGNNFAEIAFTRLVTAADCQNACAKRPKCMSWTTNGPFSCMLKDGMPLHAYEYGIISGLKGEWSVKDDMLVCKRPGFYAQSGDISLYPVKSGSEVTSLSVEDDPEVLWDIFKKTGRVSNDTAVNSTGLNGAVSITTKLKPKQKKILTIIMAWYFPNRGVADERVGNFYNNLYKSSIEVAKHAEKDLTDTLKDIIGWQSTFTPSSPSLPAQKEAKSKKAKGKQHKCTSTVSGVNVLPDCLQDVLANSLSTLRTGMWMENGRWRQWEAFDCANMDPVHVDFHRIIPYVIVYPEIAKQVMLAWADHQLENGMIQESLSMGCLEETSKEGVAGGRLMTDVNVGFIAQAYLIYSWTNDTSFFDEIYPFTVRAMEWLMKESTKGTGLPYRKPDTYDLFELEKYDHCAYNSFLYLLALNAMKKMSTKQKDAQTLADVVMALERAEKQLDVEMWDDKREFYHAWFDIEWGSPAWLMSDVLYGQVWAYTLGIGELVDKEKLKKHLKREEKRNDSPFGLKAITKSDKPVQQEDTSVILGDELNSCKSLENITKSESIWMTSSTDWSTLQLHLGLNPKQAMEQASKSLDNYRSNLRDQWNIHGLTSSKHYGLDGLPWATSHYTFHLMLWHLPLALSGQQYHAPTGKLSFNPRYEAPYWLPFYTPQCLGNIEAKEIANENATEIMFGLKVTSGECKLTELSISDSKYGESNIVIKTGETLKWSTPKKTKKDIVKAMLDQLKHR